MSFPHSTCALFIDSNISNYHDLINGTNQAASTLIIPSNQDGIIYITQHLNKSVKTLHLVSHGSPGCLYIGNTQLNLNNIYKYANSLQQWQLDTILIYGCQVACGDAGSELIEKLHKITGATILASKSLTGNQEYGGNWELEVTKGDVIADIIFKREVAESYAGILQETIVVNTVEDENNGINVAGVSLREAINRANAVPGRDRIEFDPSLANSTITLSLGETLDIVEDVIITGVDAENLTINGNSDENRIVIFNIDDGLRNIQSEVSIENIRIINGLTSISSVENLTLEDSIISGSSDRAIILNNSTSRITNSVIENNGQINDFRGGGGLQVNSTILTIVNSTIENNYGDSGGGLNASSSSLTINDSTISNNSSANYGGGLNASSSSLTINDSTISNNSSNRNGGGLFASGGNLVINNTTISGNSATYYGGGINFNSATSYITNSTITNNQAPDTQGSGINVSGRSGLSQIGNTIIAGNVNSDIDFNGDVNTFTSLGGNLIGFGTGARVFTETKDSTAIEDPLLEDLADNGGATQTHLLQPNSSAIDGGINNLIPDDVTTDQRGETRIFNDTVDIGAVELTPLINGTNQSDRLLGGDLNDTINGLGGDDTIFGNRGEDLLNGGFNDDQLFGGSDNDLLIGGAGDDSLDGGTGDDTMRGSDGDDTYSVDSVNDIVENEKPNAEGGIDTIISSVSWALGPQGRNVENLIVDDNRFVAGIGNVLDNRITGTNSRNRLSGGSGNDTIDGGRQSDRLLGNSGNDLLIGSFANDLLEGGLGRDTFLYESILHGGDTIVDFNSGADFISLSRSGFGGGLNIGVLDEEQFLIVEDIEDIESGFTLGVVYATSDGALAYLDEGDLTNIATLEGTPTLESTNIILF